MLLGAGGLVVETPSPDALCPPLEPTREFVRARLGELELEGTWRASYVLVHRARGDFVALTLRDPAGAVRLERELPAQGGSCSTLGQVIALVLERFFMRPEAEPVASTVEAAPTTTSEATPVAPEAPAPSAPPELAPAPLPAPITEPSPLPYHSVLSAGLGITSAWFAPTFAAGFERGPYRFELRLGFDLQDHEARLGTGSLRLRRAPVGLAVTRNLTTEGGVVPSLGLELTGLYERAETSALAVSSSAARLVPGLSARFGLDFPLVQRLPRPFLAATATLLFGGAGRQFLVDSREVAEPPTWVLGLEFGIRTPL